MDRNLRLRLVVRRHGLPEARILFNVPLDNDPTVAQLVELVNESIPLENDEWGLDDYTVELRAKDGHAFECMHFQPVASILDKDDELFIRPLLTNDLKKRRISGRDQISSGGQHLIDGVPFGRPRLRAPRGRPAIHIAPRKRRRLTYDGDFDQDESDEGEGDQGETVDGQLNEEYFDSTHGQEEEAEPLLLTQHGEHQYRKDHRRVHFPRSVTASADFEDTDSQSESGEDEDTEVEDDQDEDMFEPDSEDLHEELRGLAEEAAEGRPIEESHDDPEYSRSPKDGADKRPSVTAPSTEQVSELESPTQSSRRSTGSRNQPSHDASDKVIAVRSAFPAVSSDVCEKLLTKHNHDVGSVWKKLAQQLKPRLDLAQTMVLNTQLELPREIMVISSPLRTPAEAPGEVSRIGDDDDDATDEYFSADDDEDDAGEPEAHVTSSEGEDDDGSSDSDSDSGAEHDSTPRPPSAANDADSTDSSSDGSDSSDDESEIEDHPTGLSTKVLGGKRASRGGNESLSVRARPSSGPNGRQRRNVVESSPASSRATNAISDAGDRGTMVPTRAASPSDVTESSSSESDSEGDSEEDSDEESDEGSSEDGQVDSSDSSPDSSSSSDSSSESEAEAEIATPPRTKKSSQKGTTATALSTKPGPPSAASQSSIQPPVAPGQGLTKTQRRNARRRIQKAAQRTPTSIENPRVSPAQDADLMAKKKELLQSLGVSLDVFKGVDEPSTDRGADTSRVKVPEVSIEEKEDPDAWRKKISYRAVECVNEGVELSEPPFPFVQRWDSSQRRGKRKSRDDAQFYDGSHQHDSKKRKCDQSSRQPANNHKDDMTTFSLYQDDVTLNYDDEPVDLGKDRMEVEITEPDQPQETDEDDLPSLPAEMSSLPQLFPNDLQPGLIIAWKQLLLTKANNWQPQLSNFVTAAVTEVEDGGDFQVQLAKRDRDVDKNEKEYDDEGGRIYAKFEVPDDEEDNEEADLGFRDVSFAEMIDPRIVQKSFPPASEVKTSHLSDQNVEVADSQPSHDVSTKSLGSYGSHGNESIGNKTVEQDGQGQEATAVYHDSTDGPITAGDSFVSETNHDMIADNERDNGAQSETLDQDVSMSEERRNEISQLINEGGFRQEVRSSIDQSTFLHFGSPSRQLEEEASSMLPSRQLQSPRRTSSEEASEEASEAPSEYGSKDPSQQESHLAAVGPVLDNFHSAVQSPNQLGADSDNAHEIEGASGPVFPKGNVDYPNLEVSFTSQTSARSGRQIDPNFITHSDDLGHGLTDDSAIMDAFADDDAASDNSNVADERRQANGDGQERTPTQQIYDDDLLHAQNAVAPLTPLRSTEIGLEGIDPPASAGSASTGTSSIFVDFKLLDSQPAMTRFKEHVKEETGGSQINVKGEQPSQGTQGMRGLHDINEAPSAAGTRSSSPENGRIQSVNGTPVSQRSHRMGHVTRSGRQSPSMAQKTDEEQSVSQRTRRSSRLMSGNSSPPVAPQAEVARKGKKTSVKGSPTPNGKPKSLIASFNASVSPPALSKLRQKPGRASSSSPGGKGKSILSSKPASNKTAGVGKSREQKKDALLKVPAGSQIVSLLTSSPGAEVEGPAAEREDWEDELRFDSDPDDPFAEDAVETYADDNVDGDFPSTINKLQSRRSLSSRAIRGASVPVAEIVGADDGSNEEWVASTYQGPGGRKASGGKIGGRWF
ncbi:hypothetical protein Daus18300_007449 [Diaporthe australafricana]|uniref:DUF7357 domain-containing protein n=1 Tax=Diaporthe australafricana TaxID=127596 RepID=A0ABR3WN68_9PEZI